MSETPPAPPAGPAWTEVLGKLDAETIGHIENKGWKKDDPLALVTEMTKAWKAAERHIGAPADRIIRLPDKPDDAAGWSAVRQKLGAPVDAKDYDFSAIKFSDGSDLEQGFTDSIRQALHKAGTPKDHASDIVRSVVKVLDDAETAAATERTARITAEQNQLKQDWGPNFDFNRLTAMQGVKRALGTGDDAAAQSVVDAMQGAMGYKATMEFWRKIGAGTSEASFHEGGTTGNPTTINGAVARRQELTSDPEWSKRYLAGGAKETAEMNALIALITGAAA